MQILEYIAAGAAFLLICNALLLLESGGMSIKQQKITAQGVLIFGAIFVVAVAIRTVGWLGIL